MPIQLGHGEHEYEVPTLREILAAIDKQLKSSPELLDRPVTLSSGEYGYVGDMGEIGDEAGVYVSAEPHSDSNSISLGVLDI